MSLDGAVRWNPPAIALGVEPAAPDPEELAREERARIELAARQTGYEAGFARGLADGRAKGQAEGFQEGQAEARRLIQGIESILTGFTTPLARLDDEIGDALGELAVHIAGTLLGHAYQNDPTLLAALVQEAMLSVQGTEREVELRMNPDDIGALSPFLAAMSGVRMISDAALARGDLRVHSENMRVDCTMKTRLETCLARLLRGQAGGKSA